nr:MAG TPA: hypothetical protein [Caudoviricetes sp.]DAY22445.1 MAG TPA: hypothetical protein [Caudoviricetes sp.]
MTYYQYPIFESYLFQLENILSIQRTTYTIITPATTMAKIRANIINCIKGNLLNSAQR